MKDTVIFLVGPTATGKSEIAVRLAKKINGEIISCDSMQVYKGMDIVTSKPPAALKQIIPHHLLGILPVGREYDASRYYKDASGEIKKILRRGKIPLVVGGTGLYMSTLIDGIFKGKGRDDAIRNRLYKQAEEKGGGYLYGRLKKIDPEAAKKIHPNDTKRIVRALEVFEATGEPISRLQRQRKGLFQKYRIKIFCVNMPREKLYLRIDKRVDKMFGRGLVSEARRLLKSKLSKTASYAIGLRELKGYFGGLYDLKEAKRLIKRNTRLYSKRQMTWFRKDKRIQWLEIKDKEKPQTVADRIAKELVKGFTLLELVVVIVIIGILATLGYNQYISMLEKGRSAEATTCLGTARKLAHEYYLKNGTLTTIAYADLGIGTGGLPQTCASTNYFYYNFNTATDTSVKIYAVRCQSGGKTPNWTGNGYCLGGYTDFSTGAITGHCGCGSGCSQIGLPWDF